MNCKKQGEVLLIYVLFAEKLTQKTKRPYSLICLYNRNAKKML